MSPNVQVFAHIPEVLTRSPEKRAAIVYAHGGGCVAGRAEEYQPFTAALAVESGKSRLVPLYPEKIW